MIENILFTDMTKHMPMIAELNGLPYKDDFDIKGKHKPDIMKSLVHAADVGNPSRPYDICKLWSLRILSEFFA